MTPNPNSTPTTTRRRLVRYLCGTCALAEARVHRWAGPWWGLRDDDARPPCTCGAPSSVATTTTAPTSTPPTTPQPQHVWEGS